MYLRHTIRKKDGKVHRYWTLVRSIRVGRRVIQQTVAQLGELDERGRIEARALARRLIVAPEEAPLFNDGSEHLTASVRLKGVRVGLATSIWRSPSGVGWGSRSCAGACCRWGRNASDGGHDKIGATAYANLDKKGT